MKTTAKLLAYGALIASVGLAGVVTARAADLHLLNVSYDPTRELYEEFNKAFVLMQYVGYLRRNPVDNPEPALNYDGYNFWLSKLNQFNGNFINAEMVKAFITSSEYRQRFGPS